MNWSKIKNIFIILLILANIIVFTSFNYGKITESNINEKEITLSFVKKMKEKGIDVSRLKPITSRELKVLYILYEDKDLDLEKEREKYIKKGFKSYDSDKENGYLYSYDDMGNLNIEKYNLPAAKKNDLSVDDLKVISKKYIPIEENEDISYKFASSQKTKDGDYELHYEQLYKGIPVLDGFIILKMRGEIPISLIQKRVFISETPAKVQTIIPYSHALYNLYVGIEEKDLPIVFDEVNIVHQLKSDDQEKSLISGETFPYYRFVSKEKGVYLIKALSDFEQ